MGNTRFIRTAGLLGMIAGLIEFCGGIATTAFPALARPTSSSFFSTQILFAITGVFLLMSVVGLVLSGAAGKSWLGKIGLGLALLGRLLLIPGELALLVQYETGQALLGICTPVIGLGMLLCGIAVLREQRWRSWTRFTPFVCGLYTFLIILPAFAITGGPNFLAIAGWGVCWLLFGLALWTESAERQIHQPVLRTRSEGL